MDLMLTMAMISTEKKEEVTFSVREIVRQDRTFGMCVVKTDRRKTPVAPLQI
jgi:hypothetical protein